MKLSALTYRRAPPTHVHFICLSAAPLLIVLIAFCQTIIAATPRDDFVKWYADWLQNSPKSYEVSLTDFFNVKPGAEPWVMKTSKWAELPYRLTIISNSRVKKDLRFLQNPNYSARIEAVNSEKPAWSVSDLVLKSNGRFDELTRDLTASFGTRLELGLLPGTFDRPCEQVLVSESGERGNRKAEVQITFEKQPAAKERDLQQMTLFLDEAIDWSPTEIRKLEIGGLKSRFLFSGWHQVNSSWVYRDVTIYIQLPGKPEILHTKETWSFPPVIRVPGSPAECFLSHYGLHEPTESFFGSWSIMFAIAVLLLILAYRIWTRRQESR